MAHEYEKARTGEIKWEKQKNKSEQPNQSRRQKGEWSSTTGHQGLCMDAKGHAVPQIIFPGGSPGARNGS